jgi:prepilin-type N-terminal cleavage/methylation domain-containing protein
MEAAMKKPSISRRTIRNAAAQGGFSLIEVMISVAILTIGSIGLLGVFGLAVKATQTTQEDMVSRQLAAETMESIYTARNSAEIGWPAIANVSNGGIFVDGLQNIKCAGPDGILDTADDASCLTASGGTCPNGGIECLTEPGPDGVLGTADDVVLSLANYQRQVQILPLYTTGANPTLIQTLAQVSITIQYTPPSQSTPKQYVLNEYVSAYH